MTRHDDDLAAAFDQQAAEFERAPVQSDAGALDHLVTFTAPADGARVLDCGCGPGLVAEAFLRAGCDVTGVDLSAEMVRRARARCAPFAGRFRFERASLFDADVGDDFDAVLSRFVLHHVSEPMAFVRRQAALARPGGTVVACDHTTDPQAGPAEWHREIELLRDRTHTRSLTAGELVDLFAEAGLVDITCEEEAFDLDFDEWFDRGTPAAPKDEVRARLLSGSARGFRPTERLDGGVTITCWRALVRGIVPADG